MSAVSKLTSLRSVFQKRLDPLIVLLNERGVVVYRTSTSKDAHLEARAFPVDVSLEQSLKATAKWIRNEHKASSPPVQLVLGGQYSHTIFEKADTPKDVDVTLTRQRGSKETLCEVVMISPPGEQTAPLLQTVAFDRAIVKTAVDTFTTLGITIAAVESLASLIASSQALSAVRESIGFSSPFEYCVVNRGKSSPQNITSDVGCFAQDDRTQLSALHTSVSRTIPLEECLPVAARQMTSLRSIFSRKPASELFLELWSVRFRIVFRNSAVKTARIAAVAALLFLAMGFWQSAEIQDANANTSEVRALIKKRDSLLEAQRAISAKNSNNELIQGLPSATLLGALGQQIVTSGYLNSINVSRNSLSSGEGLVKGTAENEAEIFGYLELLNKELPGFDVSLQTIIEKRIRSRTKQTQSKEFTIRVAR